MAGTMDQWLAEQREADAEREQAETTAELAVRDFSEAELTERLAALVAAGGSTRRAVKRLKAQDIDVTTQQLDALRDHHSGMYLALASEMNRAQEEAIAQQFRELVIGANRVTAAYVDQLAEDVEAGKMPKDIERTVAALAKVAQVSTDKLLAITGRPVSGQGGDPLESARKLVEMGLLTPVERPSVDSTAEEVGKDG